MHEGAAAPSYIIRSTGFAGARRKFPKEVSSGRKFSFPSDFLPVQPWLHKKICFPEESPPRGLSSAKKMPAGVPAGG